MVNGLLLSSFRTASSAHRGNVVVGLIRQFCSYSYDHLKRLSRQRNEPVMVPGCRQTFIFRGMFASSPYFVQHRLWVTRAVFESQSACPDSAGMIFFMTSDGFLLASSGPREDFLNNYELGGRLRSASESTCPLIRSTGQFLMSQ